MGCAVSSNNLGGSKELADGGNVLSQSQPTAKDSPSPPPLSSVVRRNRKRRQRQYYQFNVKNILGHNNTVPVTPTEHSPSPSPQRWSMRKGKGIFRAAPSVSCNCCCFCVACLPFQFIFHLVVLAILQLLRHLWSSIFNLLLDFVRPLEA